MTGVLILSRQSSRSESANRRGTIRTTEGSAVYRSQQQCNHAGEVGLGVELRKRSEVERMRGVSGDRGPQDDSEGVLTGRDGSFGRDTCAIDFDFVPIFLRRMLVGTREEGIRRGGASSKSSCVTDNWFI